jgi:hypothetical protein
MIYGRGVDISEVFSVNNELIFLVIELTLLFFTVIRISNHLSVKMARLEFRVEELEKEVGEMKTGK